MTKTIRREMKRRAAVGPVIGHVKAEHRMDRNYLRGCAAGAEGRTATAPTQSWRRPATTSTSSSDGWKPFCVP
jgi:IS5 family transposase